MTGRIRKKDVAHCEYAASQTCIDEEKGKYRIDFETLAGISRPGAGRCVGMGAGCCTDMPAA